MAARARPELGELKKVNDKLDGIIDSLGASNDKLDGIQARLGRLDTISEQLDELHSINVTQVQVLEQISASLKSMDAKLNGS